MKVLSLFDGISCGMVALERAGIPVDAYYASEIDKNAIAISQKNYPNIIRLGDVTKWREWDIPWAEIGLLIGGSPCQGFSVAGKQLNFNDPRSKMFFEFVDILNHIGKHNPNVKFLFENVASMNDESKQVISELLGCKPVFINSNRFVAQDRPRYYWTNIPFEKVLPPVSLICLKDIMQNDVPEKYFYNFPLERLDMTRKVCAHMVHNNLEMHRRVYNPSHKVGCLTAVCGGNQQRKVLDGDRARKLTPMEYERLQGLPDDYTSGACDGQRYKAIGNGWTVDVIAHILKGLKES